MILKGLSKIVSQREFYITIYYQSRMLEDLLIEGMTEGDFKVDVIRPLDFILEMDSVAEENN
jgi:hypothetical protein